MKFTKKIAFKADFERYMRKIGCLADLKLRLEKLCIFRKL